jgi:hypothetical protein
MTVDDCSGIEEYNNGSLVTLYPNPSAGNIVLDASRLRMLPASVSVFDIRGQLVNISYEIKDRSAIITTESLEDGIYYYRITDKDNEKTATGKFIISK